MSVQSTVDMGAVMGLMAQGDGRTNIARKLGLSESAAARAIKRVRKGESPQVTTGPTPFIPYPAAARPLASGMSRDQAQMRYDTPARLAAAMDAFIAGMKPEVLYEDNEVVRACKVGRDDQDYWSKLVEERKYAQYSGFSERDARLWGTLDDIKWATENITGFRKAV